MPTGRYWLRIGASVGNRARGKMEEKASECGAARRGPVGSRLLCSAVLAGVSLLTLQFAMCLVWGWYVVLVMVNESASELPRRSV